MKKFLLLSLLLPGLACAQARFGHFDQIELRRLEANEAARISQEGGPRAASPMREAANTPLTIFMRVADDATVGRVETAGGEITLRAGNILIVDTTLGEAEELAAIEGVVTVSLPQELIMNEFTSPVGIDMSREWIGLDKTQSGAKPLPKAYAGEGVLVGIIDGGIDPNHVMFDDEDGNSRVKRIMNHVQVGTSKLTQKSETPEKIRAFQTDSKYNTHGTHTMGIMAGSFDAGPDGPNVMGAAPKADIVVKCGVTDNARLIQGLKYLVDYAKEVEKPIAVNISLGSNSGPHDGTDEFPAALQEYASMDGVTVCVSSGNEGADQAFLYHEFTENTPLKTIIWASQYTDYLYSTVTMMPMYPQAIGQLQVWSDDDTPFDVYFDYYALEPGVGPVLKSTFKAEPGKTCYMTTTGRAPVTSDVVKIDDEVFNGAYLNSFIGCSTSTYAANNRYLAEVNFQLECEDQNKYVGGCMSLRIEGKPGHKVYVYGLPMSSLFGYSLLSGGFEDKGFTGSYADGSINAMAGARDVISVGSFVTHNFKKGIAAQYTVGTTSDFSSWGHMPDGRVHPLISAPGNFIISSMNSYYWDYYKNHPEYDGYKDERVEYYKYTDQKGKTHYWTPMSGTSMASPFMTGVVATWLSADPTLTTAEILSIAQETADSPVETRPNDGTGCFVNAYKGLCKVLNLAGINNVKNDDEIHYSIGRDGNTFTVLAPAAASIEGTLFTLGGIATLSAHAEGQQLTVDASDMAPGIYVLSLRIGNTVHSEKIAIR